MNIARRLLHIYNRLELSEEEEETRGNVLSSAIWCVCVLQPDDDYPHFSVCWSSETREEL